MKFLLIILAIVAACSPLCAQELDPAAKFKIIQKELLRNKAELEKTRNRKQEVLGKLASINVQLRSANKKLNRAKEKITDNQAKIGTLVVELQKTEVDLNKKSTVLERRIREAYKSGGVNYLDLVFAARSMSDFLSRLYYFEKIISQDTSVIQGVKSDLMEAKTEKKILAEKNSEIKELAGVIAQQKDKISQQAAEKKMIFKDLTKMELEQEAKIEELERSSKELEVLIQKKMAQRTQAGIYAKGSGLMIWPLRGRITSRYGVYRRYGRGHRHTGVDIATTHGTPILAADSGEVIFSGWWDGYGKAIVIDHGKGIATVYGHMSRLIAGVGAVVSKGQSIGLEGSTGNSTGPHLHFEVRKNGTVVNPMPYLP
ncbi:MAG: peptidoglycan DD-metalloendopeptidase family protein [Candidatus Margulisiibacteriota bacterium]